MQKIRIDFDNPGLPQHISAVENDSQSRFFQATLYENGKAYTAPEGAAYSIMYRGFGPQNQGWYDTINDGAGKRAACAVSGNVVTCEIARQALQVPGHVSIVLCVTTGKGYMIKSWPIECDCKNDRYDSTVEIQSFFYITQVSNEDWNRAIQALEEFKNTIDPTLSLSGKAADAKATGDEVNQLKEDIGELQDSVYNTHQEYVEVTNGIVMLSGSSITKISSTTFTVESSSTNNIKGCKVKEGEKIKITCFTINEYNGFGYVWASTEQTPEIWNGSNALPMLSSDTYDYFCGNTDKIWKTYEMELTVPSGAKMIWVRTENSYPIYKLYKTKESKIPTKTSQLENDSGFLTKKNLSKINNIFSLPVPTVSVGILENQMLHTLYNESVPLWKFQEVGTIDFGEVSVPHNSNDTVGLWIYCNETMLSYRGNTDGTMDLIVNGVKIDTIYVAYKFRVGWNYLPIKVTENKFNFKIAFTLVRGNYEFAIDSVELNYVPKVKPKVLLSFDMGSETMYTNRHLLLKEYGFRATYCNIWGVSEANRNKMLAYGDDWAIYGNDSTSNTVYPGDSATVEEFEEYLQKTIDRAESIGLFNPISYFSPNNAGFQNLMQALKNKGYRLGRTAVSGQYAIDYFGKDSFYINTYGVGGEETSANVLKAIDDAINAGNSICIFTHNILENPSDNMDAKKSTYVEILDGIKERVNAGKCEVCTFTDFYREWMPNDCTAYLENRHEKEKQYIIGKLSS